MTFREYNIGFAVIHKISHEELHMNTLDCRWVQYYIVTEHQKVERSRIRKETVYLLNNHGQRIILKS